MNSLIVILKKVKAIADIPDFSSSKIIIPFLTQYNGLHRLASVELLRSVFDAAMSAYLNRFLRVSKIGAFEFEIITMPRDELEMRLYGYLIN